MVRGEPPRTARETVLQRETIEQILVDKGVSLREIRGVDRRDVTLRKRHDPGASVRRAMASVGRKRGWALPTIPAALATAIGGYTGTVWLLAVGWVLVTLAIAFRYAPEWVYTAPDPITDVTHVREDGMTESELMRRFGIVAEREEYRAEKIEEQRKRQERKAKSRHGRV